MLRPVPVDPVKKRHTKTAAVRSVRVGKPVRCMLDRDEDMMSTGTRHPFLTKYKVIFNCYM